MRACMSFALRGNGHVIHSDNNESFEGVNMAESIRDVMTSNPRSLESGSSAVEAARLMRDEDVGIVPIVEGKKLVGTVTDRDIASRELVTIDPQQDLDDALRLMARHQVRRLPVVEEDGKLVGIVAQKDVAMHASEAQTGEVVEDISR